MSTAQSSAPRILHLIVRGGGGGTETNVNRLCAETPNFEAFSLESVGGYPVRWWKLPRLVRALRARRPDVVFCYGITTHVLAVLAWPFGGPVLVGSIRCVSDFNGAKGALLGFIQWRFSEWVSNSKAALTGRSGIVIYNGTPVPPLGEEPLLKGLERPVVGLVARGHPKKGHDFMLKLWRDIGGPGTLVFAGELGSELESRAEAAGVVCPGFVPTGPLMKSLDLLVIPSTAEGVPTVALEAMTRGVPVLATPAGGTGELIEHGNTGFLLPREDWLAFFRSNNSAQLRSAGERGRHHVRQNFSFEHMRREFEILAADLAQRKRQ